MFITESDFNKLPYKLPSMSAGAAEEFQDFVDSEEKRYLKEVLGSNLYDAFIAGLVSDWVSTAPTVSGNNYAYGNDVWEALTVQTGTAPAAGINWALVEEDNRWLLLKNGNTYLMNDKRYTWGGMVKALIALIYSRWVEYNASQLTVNGFVIPKTENNYSVDSSVFICRAWNDWCSMIGGAYNSKDTLYGYLYYINLSSGTFDDTFDETFDTFVDYLAYEFKCQLTRNTFGL